MSIPEKLYIPTSTINLSLILSSESISPKSFYGKRCFDPKSQQFELVEPNNIANILLLYDKCPVFDICNTEKMFDYPLVVEIDTKYLPYKDEIIHLYKEGIYYSVGTIYLNPRGTTFIFATNKSAVEVYRNIEAFSNVKMANLYSNIKYFTDINLEKFEYEVYNFDALLQEELDNEQILKDEKIDKLKGLLYGEVIGFLKTQTPDETQYNKLCNELRNYISAYLNVLNNGVDTKNNDYDRNLMSQIFKLYNDLSNLNYKIQNGGEKYEIVRKSLAFNGISVLDILKKLQDEGYKPAEQYRKNIVDAEFERMNFHWKIPYFDFSLFKTPVKYKSTKKGKTIQYNQSLSSNTFNNSIDLYFENLSLKNKNINVDKLFVIDVEDLIRLSNNQVHYVPTITKLKDIYNVLLDSKYTVDFIENYENKLNFIDCLINIFKENNYESIELEYLSLFQKRIKSYGENTEFNKFSGEEIGSYLKQLSLFLDKINVSIESIERYLDKQQIHDRKVIYALCGIVKGFCQMSKTLTNVIFQSNNKEKMWEIYNHIFKQIHSIEPEALLLDPKKDKIDSLLSNQVEKDISNNDFEKQKREVLTWTCFQGLGDRSEKPIKKILDSCSDKESLISKLEDLCVTKISKKQKDCCLKIISYLEDTTSKVPSPIQGELELF